MAGLGRIEALSGPLMDAIPWQRPNRSLKLSAASLRNLPEFIDRVATPNRLHSASYRQTAPKRPLKLKRPAEASPILDAQASPCICDPELICEIRQAAWALSTMP